MNIAKHIIGGLLLAAATAHANTATSLCSAVGELAESIMRNRQNGISIAKMIEVAEGNKIAEILVYDAFKQGRFTSEAFKERAVQDFRERAEVDCLRGLKSSKGNT